MKANKAYNLLCKFQKEEKYIVPDEQTKVELIRAMKYLFEENSEVYTKRIVVQ